MTTLIIPKELAEAHNLQHGYVTGGNNGYPTPCVGEFIHGFADFAEAEKFASEHKGHVYLCSTKNGWSVYQLQGERNSPLTASDYIHDLGDNYNKVSSESVAATLAEVTAEDYSDETIADLEHLLKETQKDEAQGLVTVAFGYEYHETIPPTNMGYGHDATSWVIGVFFWNEQIA